MIVWRMTADVAEKFYTLCIERNAQTEEERVAILAELKDEMLSISLTKRSPEQLIKDLSSHGEVLVIRPNESKPSTELRPEQDNS